MYIPPHFNETDPSVLHNLIRSYPFAAWVTQVESELTVNHLPFLLKVGQDQNDCGRLVGHVARANPVWTACSSGVNSVVVFQGAQSYISPSWYPSKQDGGKAVPTWNYAVVHAHGQPRVIDDRDWLLQHVSQLSELHERQRNLPWRITDAPTDYIEHMLRAIIGIEIPITRLEGKWKVSQNRSEQDRLGVVAGLREYDDPAARDMAELVQTMNTRIKK